jgi:lysophospholipid acyltransferase (LPLAT)-like uncharacterized protein
MMKLIPILIYLICGILGKTWRFNVVSPASVNIFDPKAAPKIYCFWHSTLLVISYLFGNTGKAAIVSRSKDGRIAAEVAKRWGHEAIFGSSARGGADAMRQSVRSIKAGRSLGITPDGPKGPVNVAKPGAAQIAIVSKAPLVTIKAETERAWRLKSWDRFMIPKPFAKINITLSEPIYPPSCIKAADDDSSADKASGNTGIQAFLTKQIQDNLA